MSQLECACGDVMMATCSTGADTAAYLALAIVAISVAVVRMCTCNWDEGDSSSDDDDAVRSMFS